VKVEIMALKQDSTIAREAFNKQIFDVHQNLTEEIDCKDMIHQLFQNGSLEFFSKGFFHFLLLKCMI
jgi:hypothetical protein